MRRVLLPLLLVLALPVAPAQANTCAGADTAPNSANLQQIRSATLCLLNEHRRARGLAPLRNNDRLQTAASRFSLLMVRQRFFDHTAPDGTTFDQRIESAGYGGFSALAENIAWGAGTESSPEEIVSGWMQSSGHRRNILDRRLHEIGIGIAARAPLDTNGQRGATYTTDFGSRR